MTISSQTRKVGPFTGDDATTAFPFAFKVFTAADLLVVRLDTTTSVETTLTLTTDYTVTLNGNQNANPGGTVTLTAPLATGTTLVVTSSIDYLQPTDLTNQGGFYPRVISDALDRLTIQAQQLKEQVDRSAKVPITSADDPAGLADAIVTLATYADDLPSLAADAQTALTSAATATTQAGIATDKAVIATDKAADTLADRLLAQQAKTDAETAQGIAEAQATIATTKAGEAAGSAAATAIIARKGDAWWNSFLLPVASADMPTITVSTSSSVTGDLIQPTASMQDEHFRYDGCVDVVQPAAGYVWAASSLVGINYYCNLDFITVDGSDTLEIPVYVPSAGNQIGVRVVIDGRMSSLELQRFESTPSAVHYIKIHFPTARVRHLIVEVESISRVGGVKVPAGHTVSRPSREVQRPFGILADSFGRGAGYTTGGASGLETFAYYVARACGADRIVNFAIGGTGWVAPGSNAPFGTRVAEILESGVVASIAVGSRNDDASVASVYSAAFEALDSLSTIPYLAVGGPAQSAFSAVNDKVRAAAVRAGRPLIDVLDVITDDLEWDDGIHPNHAGHLALAKAFYDGIDTYEMDARFAAAAASREFMEVTLTASPDDVAASGEAVTFTASLSAERAGKVAFIVDGAEAARVTVSDGVADFATNSLSTDTHSVLARFIPQSPQVMPAVSNSLSYRVAATLGFTDDFNRADGAVGSPWVTGGTGTWQVVSNQLGITGIASGTGYCVREANSANGTLQFTVDGTPGNGLLAAMRYQSANNLLRISYSSGYPTLFKTIGGASTVIAACTGGAWAASDVIQVIMDDDHIVVKKNGSTVLDVTGVTEFMGKTLHGVGAITAGASGRFDDVSFTV